MRPVRNGFNGTGVLIATPAPEPGVRRPHRHREVFSKPKTGTGPVCQTRASSRGPINNLPSKLPSVSTLRDDSDSSDCVACNEKKADGSRAPPWRGGAPEPPGPESPGPSPDKPRLQ